MTLLLHELKLRMLNALDPNDLLERLNITSEELLDRFEDKIEDFYERLTEEYEDTEEE